MAVIRFLIVALIASTTLSCGGGPDAAPVTAVQDSADVAITTYNDLSHAKPPVWKLSTEPTVRIGLADGDSTYQFYRVSGVTRLSDGTIVVGDASHTLRFFDPRGKLTRKIGGDGDGPGQFRSAYPVVAITGDSLLVYDSQHRRVSIFNPGGVLAREFQVGQVNRRPPVVTGVLRDGTLLAYARVGPADYHDGELQDTLEVLLIRPDGSSRQSLGLRTTSPYRLTSERTEHTMSTWRNSTIFGRRLVLAGAGDHVFVWLTNEFNIRVYDVTGAVRQVIRSSEALQPTTKDMLDRYHEFALDGYREGGMPETQIAVMRKHQAGDDIAPTLPPFSGLIATSDGNLWMRQFQLPWDEGPSTWWMFDRDNKLIGTITLPVNFGIREVQGDRVLGVETDDMDVEYVVDYRLEQEAVDGS